MPEERSTKKHKWKLRKTMPTMSDPQRYDDYMRGLYKIETLNSQESVNSLGKAYTLFRRNWPDTVMTWISACKTIVLDKDRQAISLIYFEPDGKISKEHISRLFGIIKENFSEASSVLVAVNNPVSPFEAGEKENSILSYFNECGERNNTSISDQYIISPLGMSRVRNPSQVQQLHSLDL